MEIEKQGMGEKGVFPGLIQTPMQCVYTQSQDLKLDLSFHGYPAIPQASVGVYMSL